MELDNDTCYRALVARDERFDGVFFVAVKSTGIYCRPVCSARTPARRQCAFYLRAVEAERDGFRACFRCRPELAPGTSPAEAVPRLVEAAVARIEAGFLNQRSIDDLARELGVTARHLRRATAAELGVSPVELAQARRMAFAKRLLQDTALSMAEVAFASGFASVRRFNALFQARFGKPPSALRRERAATAAGDTILLRLDYRPPLDWQSLLGFLEARAIPGVESVQGGVYRRTIRVGVRTGWVSVRADGARPALRAEVSPSLAGALMPLAASLRALFDLDAQPHVIAAQLGADRTLAGLVREHPGLRVPGAVDGLETTVRAILGQQVSVRAATTVSGRLAAELGEPMITPYPELRRLAPTAEAIAGAGEERLAGLGMPGARARTLVALARAVLHQGLRLQRHVDIGDTVERLQALPGIGDWTAQYVAMRVLGWPDAFPADDLGIRRALGGMPAREARARAEGWRPWRAYAAMHLWQSLMKGAVS